MLPDERWRTAIAFNSDEFRVTEEGDVPVDQQPPDLLA